MINGIMIIVLYFILVFAKKFIFQENKIFKASLKKEKYVYFILLSYDKKNQHFISLMP